MPHTVVVDGIQYVIAFNLLQEYIRIREDKEGEREPILAAVKSLKKTKPYRFNCTL